MKLLFLIAILGLAACSPPRNNPSQGGEYNHFTTNEGLNCVSWKQGYAGGVSCNWEKFNKEAP